MAACVPKKTPPSSPVKTPSKVVTQDGMEFSVYGLRLPGTRQELKLRSGEAITWLPLAIVQFIRFSGPAKQRFRPAEVILTSGEKFRGELFVGHLIEGTTDIGYWNMPLDQVRILGLGQD